MAALISLARRLPFLRSFTASPLRSFASEEICPLNDNAKNLASDSGPRKDAGGLREDKDALYLRVDMPGLGKENVKVSIEGAFLFVVGELKFEGTNIGSRCPTTAIHLGKSLQYVDTSNITFDAIDGVIKVKIPKKKPFSYLP